MRSTAQEVQAGQYVDHACDEILPSAETLPLWDACQEVEARQQVKASVQEAEKANDSENQTEDFLCFHKYWVMRLISMHFPSNESGDLQMCLLTAFPLG